MRPGISAHPSSVKARWVGPKGLIVQTDEVPTYLAHAWAGFLSNQETTLRLWNRWGRRIFERYQQEQGLPDLVHAHGVLGGGTLGAELKHRYGLPLVITAHSEPCVGGKISQPQRALVEGVLSAADARIVVSSSLGRQFESLFGSKMLPWDCVPNLVDSSFRPLSRPPQASATFRFLNVGLMTEVKRQSDLLCAFSQAFSQDRNVELRLIGDGPEQSNLAALASKLGISERVVWLGKLDRPGVVSEMQRAQAIAVSSRYETFGVVLIEALACGKPVVSTKSGGPEEIVDEKNGLLVPLNNVDEMARALTEMRRHAGRYDPNRIRGRCLARFSPEVVTSSLLRVYGRALENRN